MTVFEELRAVVMAEHHSGDFPQWLLRDVLTIADNPEAYGGQIPLVEKLVAQIRDYDPFAGAGCFDESVSAESIARTLRQLGPPDPAKGRCPLIPCCRYFIDNFSGMPKTEAYIRERLCNGDPRSCSRYRIYMDFGRENVPDDLDPDDTEAVKKILACLGTPGQ